MKCRPHNTRTVFISKLSKFFEDDFRQINPNPSDCDVWILSLNVGHVYSVIIRGLVVREEMRRCTIVYGFMISLLCPTFGLNRYYFRWVFMSRKWLWRCDLYYKDACSSVTLEKNWRLHMHILKKSPIKVYMPRQNCLRWRAVVYQNYLKIDVCFHQIITQRDISPTIELHTVTKVPLMA